ncbi:MAG TPA: DUF2007 domain-containing protein [Promineifilum sp.]
MNPLSEDRNTSSGTPGGPQQVRWEVVEETLGITAAEIIAGRLQSEGIPARAWQEGAGEALGLYVGKLGVGHVVVPEEYAERARAILADDSDALDEEE